MGSLFVICFGLGEANGIRHCGRPCIANVGRHQNDGVLEGSLTTVIVGQSSIVEHLQQKVVDALVRLLDFVEQENLMGILDEWLRQRSRLLIADIASSGADELGNAVFLLIF